MTKMTSSCGKFRGDGFIIENCIIKGDKTPNDFTKNNLGEVIFNALSKNPEHILQVDAETGKKRSFAEIKEKSLRLAVWLRKNSIKPGDVVSLCTPRNSDAEIIFCAIAFVGATYGPIEHQVDFENARHYLNSLQARVIFSYENKIETLQEAAALEGLTYKMILIGKNNDEKYETLDDITRDISFEEIESFQVTKVDPKKICVLFASSGTTGSPKFIPISNQDFVYQVFQFDINSRSNSSSNVLLTYFYPGWILQMLISMRALLFRQTLIFHEEFEPHEACKIIEKFKVFFEQIKVDTLIWDIYMISLLAESEVMNKYDVSCVRRIHSVGSKLFDGVREKILRIFPNVHYIGRGLGILEIGLVTLFTEKCGNRQSEGTVIPDVQVKIVDIKTGEALGPNKSGELCINSPCMMTGYHKNPTVSRDAFDHEGWYRSGDEAYYDDNGEIVVIGRLKEIIKYREELLQPSCIEQIFLKHPNIIDAAVVGIFHEVDVEQPIAFVQIAEGFKVTEEDILKLTCNLEPNDIFKGRVVFTDHIPRNSNGKMNRRILRERANEIYRSR